MGVNNARSYEILLESERDAVWYLGEENLGEEIKAPLAKAEQA